ncbi:MAG: ABC transporter ATP-binding protein [Mesorhizobium sp.]|nr:ABC transporter ATP-binding protein [Mesorhizobium sp.]MBL8579895.1 ABC transporter ATP-binding protein [Mesorhizobium sp.]
MTPLIAIDGIDVVREGRKVLRQVDLALFPGDRLAIVGPNGAGKTTLLRTLVGLEAGVAGNVSLFGEVCVHEADFRVARRRIGFLFQDSDDQLFCPSVMEDVAFGPLNLGQSNEQARATAEATLDQLGLMHLAGRAVHKLSGGEKRLVCLAGLLAMAPDVLLLDEPTNGVDVANGIRLKDLLLGFGGAMILVSHDPNVVADLATRALLLDDGHLRDAEIHDHPHTHVHRHIHPAHK